MFKGLDPNKNLEAFAWLYEGPGVSNETTRLQRKGTAAPNLA
jgi:hypothetical protein